MRLINTKILITGALSLLCLSGYAQNVEEADSLAFSRDLEEIVVEGRTQRVIEGGVEYIPAKNIKNAATNAVSLLSRMQIPQLRVSPIDDSVRTISNREVSFFMNYVPASAEDLEGLRTEDVLSVAVLDHPADPRFGGKEYVVNFIVRTYDWGGYTKLCLNVKILTTEAVSGSIYEKFNYRHWTFDANVYAGGTWDRTAKSYLKETFRGIMFDSREIESLERIKTTDYTHSRDNSEMASIRAAYNGNNGTFLSHTLSFNRVAMPVTLHEGGVRYSAPILPDTEFRYNLNKLSNNANITGYYQFLLPAHNSIIANWSFSYSNNRKRTSYTLGDLPSIDNDIREHAYLPYGNIYYVKQFPHGNTLRAMIANNSQIYDTDYLGEVSSTQKLSSYENMLFLEYMKNFGFGLNIFTRVGLSYLRANLNGATLMNEWNPRFILRFNYHINSKNELYFDARWNNSTPQAAWDNDATVRQDELLWTKGNPDMRNLYGPNIGLTYNFIPLNIFSMAADIRYDEYRHFPVYLYSVMQGYDGIVRSFSDDNTERSLSATLSATARLLHNSVVLNLSGGFSREFQSGINPINLSCFSGEAYAAYYVGPAGFSLYYATPSKSIMNGFGATTRTRCAYGLRANYSKGNFKVEASFHNWFSKGRMYDTFNSKVYSSDGWTTVSGYARRLHISFIYTFNYGKKVERNDDLENNAYKNSAILQ